MAQSAMKVSFELFPLSPQQKHVLAMIEEYLTGKVANPEKVALGVWRLTRITMRPIRPPVPPPDA